MRFSHAPCAMHPHRPPQSLCRALYRKTPAPSAQRPATRPTRGFSASAFLLYGLRFTLYGFVFCCCCCSCSCFCLLFFVSVVRGSCNVQRTTYNVQPSVACRLSLCTTPLPYATLTILSIYTLAISNSCPLHWYISDIPESLYYIPQKSLCC